MWREGGQTRWRTFVNWFFENQSVIDRTIDYSGGIWRTFCNVWSSDRWERPGRPGDCLLWDVTRPGVTVSVGDDWGEESMNDSAVSTITTSRLHVSRTRDWNEDENLVSSQLSAAGPCRPSYMCSFVIWQWNYPGVPSTVCQFLFFTENTTKVTWCQRGQPGRPLER